LSRELPLAARVFKVLLGPTRAKPAAADRGDGELPSHSLRCPASGAPGRFASIRSSARLSSRSALPITPRTKWADVLLDALGHSSSALLCGSCASEIRHALRLPRQHGLNRRIRDTLQDDASSTTHCALREAELGSSSIPMIRKRIVSFDRAAGRLVFRVVSAGQKVST
jgi:hypothetical protein